MGFALVVLTADGCGACTQFKGSALPALVRDAASRKNLQLVTINLASTGSPIPPGHPPALGRIVGWYPTVLLFELPAGTAWGPAAPLNKGYVFNGSYLGPTTTALSKPGVARTAPNVLAWVDSIMHGTTPTYEKAPIRASGNAAGGPANRAPVPQPYPLGPPAAVPWPAGAPAPVGGSASRVQIAQRANPYYMWSNQGHGSH